MEIEDSYIFNCPHCTEVIIVKKTEINCKIFRHAVYKNNMEPINPHTPKEECQRLFDSGTVYGCCKPFRVEVNSPGPDGQLSVFICDYI